MKGTKTTNAGQITVGAHSHSSAGKKFNLSDRFTRQFIVISTTVVICYEIWEVIDDRQSDVSILNYPQEIVIINPCGVVTNRKKYRMNNFVYNVKDKEIEEKQCCNNN